MPDTFQIVDAYTSVDGATLYLPTNSVANLVAPSDTSGFTTSTDNGVIIIGVGTDGANTFICSLDPPMAIGEGGSFAYASADAGSPAQNVFGDTLDDASIGITNNVSDADTTEDVDLANCGSIPAPYANLVDYSPFYGPNTWHVEAGDYVVERQWTGVHTIQLNWVASPGTVAVKWQAIASGQPDRTYSTTTTAAVTGLQDIITGLDTSLTYIVRIKVPFYTAIQGTGFMRGIGPGATSSASPEMLHIYPVRNTTFLASARKQGVSGDWVNMPDANGYTALGCGMPSLGLKTRINGTSLRVFAFENVYTQIRVAVDGVLFDITPGTTENGHCEWYGGAADGLTFASGDHDIVVFMPTIYNVTGQAPGGTGTEVYGPHIAIAVGGGTGQVTAVPAADPVVIFQGDSTVVTPTNSAGYPQIVAATGLKEVTSVAISGTFITQAGDIAGGGDGSLAMAATAKLNDFCNRATGRGAGTQGYLDGGINDAFFGVSLASYKTGFATIIAAWLAVNPTYRLNVNRIRYTPRITNTVTDNYNAKMVEAVTEAASSHVRVVNNSTGPGGTWNSTDGSGAGDILADGFNCHPNASGRDKLGLNTITILNQADAVVAKATALILLLQQGAAA